MDGRRQRRFEFTDPFSRGLDLLRLQALVQGRSAALLSGLVFVLCAVGVVGTLALTTPNQTLLGAARWYVAWAWHDVIEGEPFALELTTQRGPSIWTTDRIRADPWHIEKGTLVLNRMLMASGIALGLSTPLAILIFAGAYWQGRRATADRLARGREVVEAAALARLVRRRGAPSGFRIGPVPVPETALNRNILFLGTTQTGKSLSLRRWLAEIERRGEMAIVFDKVGDFTEAFYDRERGDVLLNPLDRRCPPWSPWAEIRDGSEAMRIARSLIPSVQGENNFFHAAAQDLFAALLTRVGRMPDRSLEKLLLIALTLSRKQKAELLKGSSAAKHFEGEHRSGHDVDATMAVFTQALRFLPRGSGGTTDFSIRDFIATTTAGLDSETGRSRPRMKERPPWLFIASNQRQLPALRPLLSVLLDAVADTILSLPPNRARRIWLVLDEVQSLQKLPSLPPLLTECAKYGACVCVGLQNMGQLRAAYGRDTAETVLSLFNTKAFFRMPEPETAAWVERSIGNAVIEHVHEGMRYATSSTMDGAQISMSRTTEPIVMAGDIMRQPDLHLYLMLPGDWPVGRIQLAFDKRRDAPPARSPALLRRPEEETIYHALEAAGWSPVAAAAEAEDPATLSDVARATAGPMDRDDAEGAPEDPRFGTGRMADGGDFGGERYEKKGAPGAHGATGSATEGRHPNRSERPIRRMKEEREAGQGAGVESPSDVAGRGGEPALAEDQGRPGGTIDDDFLAPTAAPRRSDPANGPASDDAPLLPFARDDVAPKVRPQRPADSN
ncbi:MAG: type IV secretion system DNA-binding domain-containing protein [Pseudomonadota bacterium]